MYEELAHCVDCGKEFIRRSKQQVRCTECQEKRRKELFQRRYEAKKERLKTEKRKKDAVYVNGHPQVCEYMKSCYYGSQVENGCSYIIEKGESRITHGLFIENGKCPAYIPKNNRRAKRQEPTHYRNDGQTAEERYRSYGEV